jgi:mRNA-degrading endonuclease RelE of RelBE toxin-antitoxin system
MVFRIADTFTASLARLSGEEQKAVKTTAFDLQLNPASPGLQFHKLERARDKSFWSVRVNADVRLIVHRTGESLLLCFVDHHDKAYAWAERRRLSMKSVGINSSLPDPATVDRTLLRGTSYSWIRIWRL